MTYARKKSIELYEMLTLIFLIQELSAREKRTISYKELHNVKMSLKTLYEGVNTSDRYIHQTHISPNGHDGTADTNHKREPVHEVQK